MCFGKKGPRIGDHFQEDGLNVSKMEVHGSTSCGINGRANPIIKACLRPGKMKTQGKVSPTKILGQQIEPGIRACFQI